MAILFFTGFGRARRPPCPQVLIFASLERLATDGSKKALFWPSAVGGLWHFFSVCPEAGPKKTCQQGFLFWSQLTGPIFLCPSYGGHP